MQHVAQPGAGQEVYTFPLSYAQEGLWLLSQLQLENPAYHIPKGFVLEGPLRVDALERSLDAVRERHEILRTTFAVLDGEPVQVVAPFEPRALRCLDLAGYPAEARDAEMNRLALEEARAPFDLVRGPLLRTTLLRLAPERHLLLCTAHHLVFDGWSERVFLRELTTFYHAFAAGTDPALPELPVQYGDYAHWERERLQGEALASLVAYWREQLAGAPDAIRLPADHPRPAEPTHRGGYRTFSLPPGAAAALAEVGRSEGATSYVPLLAAFGVLLHRLSGEDDVLVGSTSARRDRVELEQMIGFFVTPLVLRLDLSDDPSFRELVRRVRETAYAAQEHQALPFGRLVSELRPRRDPGRNPFFQVLFNYDGASARERGESSGLAIQPLEVGTRAAQFDLTLSVSESRSGVRGTLIYGADLFEEDTAAEMVRQLERVLREAAAGPDRRLSELVLTAEERRRVLVEWNRTERERPAGACLHELVAAQAARTPDAPAVAFEGAELSYGELDRRSARLANHLRALGVGPETVVAVRLERSLELPVSLLAVLRAGGAYLPVDPSYPEPRQRFMLEDSGARVLVTLAELAPAAPVPGAVRVVHLDREAGTIAGRSDRAPASGAGPDHLAYVIYTSGSTGTPKGAMNAHRGIVNRLLWMQEEYGLDASDAVLQKTPYSFDVSVWEFFWPLMTGARLVVARPEGHRDPAYLREVVEAEGVTTLHFVPSMLRPFLDTEGVERCTGLRRVVCSGEALPPDLAERCSERLPGAELHNLYGPTEAAVDVTYWRCLPRGEGRAVPIGRPVANTRVYLLDAGGNPVPPGTPGELYIGGVQVGRGYLGRPELTAERFVPDPFGGTERPGGRLYRTGDLARHRPDGAVEFLGRMDHQVKVRGFRIELGEVEAALRGLPGVRDAAVTAGEGRSGVPRLVAYVVAAGEPAPGADDLRAGLRGSLPDHMVPAAFVFMEALPLTPSGKLDRRELPEPGQERPWLAEAYVPPRTVLEDALASIWARVLGVEQVGVHDNFFALGGDSILSLRVAALARERGLPVSIRQVAMNPTVAELAVAVHAGSPASEGDVHTEPFSLVSAEDRARLPEEVEDAYPLTQLQLGMLFHQEQAPTARMFHGLSSFHLRMPLDEEAFRRAVAHVAARHPSLRTGFDLAGYSQPLQLVFREAAFPVGFTDLRHLPAGEQDAQLKRFWRGESDRPFDLARPPQLRFHLHRRTDETVQFTLLENHMISDGWSLHTVLDEVLVVYFALLRGEGVPEMPPLRTRYRDFVALERATLESPEVREFWEEYVRGWEAPDLPRLPSTAPRGRRGMRIDRVIRRRVLEALRALAREESVPLKSVLLAAHLKVLAFLTGRAEVVTGLSSNGRLETADGDRVTGLFLNTLPLRMDLAAGSWRELVRRVYREELELMRYRRYPLSAIQAAAGPRPLFEASFVYLNFHAMAEHLTSGQVGYEGSSAFLEETNFAIMTAFQHLTGNAKRVALSLECDRWVFSDEQIGEMVDFYLGTLEAIAADPSARHDLFSPLPEAQRRRILEWSGGRPAPLGGPVHRLFEEHAARAPERPCVVHEGGTLSYGEVDRGADGLALRLRGLGVGPDGRVAVLMDRVPEVVPALLAALKAGGAYVPLDPSSPRERLEWLLRDSGASAVLTLERWRPLVDGLDLPVLCLDAPAEESALPHSRTPALSHSSFPENLAYVIYTSGTTGRPKAVMVEHRQLVHYTGAVLERLDVPPGASFALISTFAADLGNTMVFPALCTGGALHVLSERQATDPAALAAHLAEHPVDCLKVVPSHLRALLAHGEPERLLPRLRLVLGGEPLDRALAERVRALAPGCRVFNHYGPTETVVGVVAGEVAAEGEGDPPAPPLGTPLGHARIYVLDARLQPVPVGTGGELWVGGEGVSRGYLGRPERTAERFLPDPFAPAPGGRMYRTGDLARFLPGGAVAFLGRADDQVKIRGFRVEPGEVAAVLRAHPAVGDAVVVARAGAGGEARLAAYVVPAPERDGAQAPPRQLRVYSIHPGARAEAGAEGAPAGGAGLEEALRSYLAGRLPEAMLPAAIVVLPALPLTRNGKLDAGALPEPAAPGPAAAGDETPRSETEAKLVELWRGVLKLEHLGIYDSFFERGGDSIKAILAVARIRKAFGVHLSMETLFDAPTVAALAGRVEAAARDAASPPPARIVPVPRDGTERLPLSFAQQRLWYVQLLDPESSSQNVPFGFRLRGRLDVDAWRRSLNEVVRRHEVLRTRFPTVDGEPLQVIVPELELEVPVLDLRSRPEDEREGALREVVRREVWRPFDLVRGPLVRALLVRTGEEEHAAVLAIHHVVFDGWSGGVLARELSTLYESFLHGRPSPLPELPVQYADFAHWQREHLRDERMQEQLARWKERLEGAPVLDLPCDRPRPPVQGYRGATERAVLSGELTDAFHALSLREGVTPFMTLLAAFAVLLYHHTAQEDVVVGSPVVLHRDRFELHGLIGLFINSLALRVDLSGGPTFRELLARVRTVALEGFACQDVPFERVVDALGSRRDASRTPVFQVMLSHSNVPREPVRFEGLEVSSLGTGNPTAKLDLSLATEVSGGRLVLWITYNTDLFEADTARRMLAQMEVLLDRVAGRADVGITELRRVLREQERREREEGRQSLPRPRPDASRRKAIAIHPE